MILAVTLKMKEVLEELRTANAPTSLLARSILPGRWDRGSLTGR